MRFTANLSNIQARQGQLCLIMHISEESATVLDVWIAPPGCRRVTVCDEASLMASDWRKATIYKVFTPVMNNDNKFLRRFSFPLKNYVASTINKCLGDTFPQNSDKNFSDGEQLQSLGKKVI